MLNLLLKHISYFSLMVIIAILGMILRFRVNAIIAHNIGPEYYGDYQITVLLIMYLGQIILLGLDGVVTKNIPGMIKKNECGKVKFLVKELFKITLIFTSVWVLISFIINVIAHNLQYNLKLSGYIHPSMYYLAYASLWGLLFWLIRVIGAKGYVTIAFASFHLPLLILWLILLNYNITFYTAIHAFAISIFAACIICLVIVRYTSKNISAVTVFSIKTLIRRDAKNYVLQNILAFSPTTILLIIVEAMPIAESRVGILSLVFLIANMLITTIVVTKAYFVNIVSKGMLEKKVTMKKLLNTICLTSTTFAIICGIAIYFISLHYLFTFGSAYTPAIALIPLALIANIPSAIIIGDIFFIKFNSKSNFYLTLLLLAKIILTIFLGVALVAYFDIQGAVWAFFIEETLYSIIIWKIKTAILKTVA